MTEFEIIRHGHISGVNLFFNTVEHRTAHFHSEWELLWVLEHPLRVDCGQQSLIVQPGQLVAFAPGQPHEFRRDHESATFLCLQISPSVLPEDSRMHVDGACLLPDEQGCLKNLLIQLAGAYFEKAANYKLLCMGNIHLVMHQLLIQLPCRPLSAEQSQSLDRRNDRLLRLFQFVDEHYMEKICLSDFAAAEGCSVTYLSHFIKQSMNQTFRSYVNTVRFHRACQLMAQGNQKMLDICLASGFSDYRYFSRVFRENFGCTPEQYSRNLAGSIPEKRRMRHSLHSVERFYDAQESLALCHRLMK